jgi:hypothetical protein
MEPTRMSDAAPHPATRRGGSVAGHLAAFAAAIVLPLLALVASYLVQQVRQDQARIEDEVRRVAASVARALDHDVDAIAMMLATLGRGLDAAPGALDRLRREAADLAARQGLAIAARRPGGAVIFAVGKDADAVLRLAAMEAHREAVETRRTAVSGLVFSDEPRRPFYLVIAPVEAGGGVGVLLEAAVPPERARALLPTGLPEPFWAASLMDRTGVLVTRSRNPEGSVGVAATDEFRRAAVGESGTWTGPSHEGNALIGGFALSRSTGWYVAVGAAHAALMAPHMVVRGFVGGDVRRRRAALGDPCDLFRTAHRGADPQPCGARGFARRAVPADAPRRGERGRLGADRRGAHPRRAQPRGRGQPGELPQLRRSQSADPLVRRAGWVRA